MTVHVTEAFKRVICYFSIFWLCWSQWTIYLSPNLRILLTSSPFRYTQTSYILCKGFICSGLENNLPVSAIVKVSSRHSCSSSLFLIMSHVLVQSHWLLCSNHEVRFIYIFYVVFGHQVRLCKVKRDIAFCLVPWAHIEGLILNHSSYFHLSCGVGIP